MKTLIFNGSPRKNGGTAKMIEELSKQLGGEIDIIYAYRAKITPCVDCRSCWNNDACVIDDDMQRVYRLIDEADNIIIASPIYFAELTGELLSMMSRLQLYWVAREFNDKELLTDKPRKGAVLLTDGGAGIFENSLAMGKRLLRIMGAKFVGSVYFSGTDNNVSAETNLNAKVKTDIEQLVTLLKKAD